MSAGTTRLYHMVTLLESARAAVQRLRSAGHAAYFAGGCVRDQLLGRPVHEYDIATSAEPHEVEALFEKTVPIGKAFGVILVLLGDHPFEVTTFRSEGPYLDGRRPSSVRFTDARTDVSRRDFTINGLLYDPFTGEVLDYVEGRLDLDRRLIRAIGDPRERFEEDRLRMLRAVRFACQLGFAIHPATQTAIRALAPRIADVSQERIREELRKILLSSRRAEGVRLLHALGLLRPILPEVAATEGIPQPPEFHPEGDVWTHTCLALESLVDPSFELAFATLLHDVAKPQTLTVADRIRFHGHAEMGEEMAEAIGRRLRLSADEIDRVRWLVGKHMVFKDVDRMKPANLRRLMAHPYFPELLELHRADRMGGRQDLDVYEKLRSMHLELPPEAKRPQPLLRGEDLIALGLTPGPRFKEILRDVEDGQLEGRLKTRDEALRHVRERWLKP